MTSLFPFSPVSQLIPLAIVTGVLCQAIPAVAAEEDSVQLSVFSGSLIQPDDEAGDILRRFEVQLFTTNQSHFFHVIDDARHGCPWPESYGRTGPSIGADKVQPHLVYDFDGQTYVIPLPPLVVALPAEIAADSTWEQVGWQFTAIELRSVDNVPVWFVEARERRGRQQMLTVDAANGTTLRAEADVFMGQGDQFKLTLSRSSTKAMEQDISDKVRELQDELLALQSTLKRSSDAHSRELSVRQIADVAAASDRLTSLASDTPLELLVRQMKLDTDQQQKRQASIANRATELMNTDAPQFLLSLMDGGKLESGNLKGKIVILHFWDYRDVPLSEPYGQTGYLEFLYNQKKSKDVTVVGVSTNPDLKIEEFYSRGRRSVRKLSEFMNLSYPVGHDDGALLKAFGDPRDDRGQLPLWIVLDANGKVAHYHAGFYEVDAAHGLKELEVVLASLLHKE
jgi:peroxiredoxin